MATLTVLKFADPKGAESALDKVESLQMQDLIKLHDAAIVTWAEGKKARKPSNLSIWQG